MQFDAPNFHLGTYTIDAWAGEARKNESGYLYPGIGTESFAKKDSEGRTHHTWYQWTPVILAVAIGLLRAARTFYKLVKSTDITDLCEGFAKVVFFADIYYSKQS